MSVKIMAAIFESETLGPTERLIMLALADHADDTGRCYPSIVRLAQRTGLSERAVRTNIRTLELSGYITVHIGAGPGGKNVYFVRANPAPPAPGTSCPPAPPAPGTSCPTAPTALGTSCPPAYDDHLTRQEIPVTPAAGAPEPPRTTIEPPPPHAVAPEAVDAKDLIGRIADAVGLVRTSLPRAWASERAYGLVAGWIARGLSPDQIVAKALQSREVHNRPPHSLVALDGFMVLDVGDARGSADQRAVNLDLIADKIRRGLFVPPSVMTPAMIEELISSGRIAREILQ